jgi:hypothetical protein
MRAVGSRVDGSDPSMRSSSLKKTSHFVKINMQANPHFGNFMKTPSNLAEIAFAQTTSHEVLWKAPRALKECKEGCQFY